MAGLREVVLRLTVAHWTSALAVANERRLHDARGEPLVADLDVHGVAGRHGRAAGGQARSTFAASAKTCRW